MPIAAHGVAADRQSLHKSYSALEEFIEHKTTVRNDSEKGKRSIFDKRWLLYVETDKSGNSTIKLAKSAWAKFSHCVCKNEETKRMLAVEGEKVLKELSMRELKGEALTPQDIQVKKAIKSLISPQRSTLEKAVLKPLSLTENEMLECWETFKTTRPDPQQDLGKALHRADQWRDLGANLVGTTLLTQEAIGFASKPLEDLRREITDKPPLIVEEMDTLDRSIAAKKAEIAAKTQEMPELGAEIAPLKELAEKLGSNLSQHLISQLDEKYLQTDNREATEALQQKLVQLQRLCIAFFDGDVGEGIGMERNSAATKAAVVQILQTIKNKGEWGLRTATSFATSGKNWDEGIKTFQAKPEHKELLGLTKALKESEAQQEMRKTQKLEELRQELQGLQTLRSHCEQNLVACGNEEKSIAQFTLFSSIKRNLGRYVTAENREALRKLCDAYCDGITPKDTARANIERFVARTVPSDLENHFQALVLHSTGETDRTYVPTLVVP